MKQKNNFLLILLSILLGGFFLFSAYSKTEPSLQSFEFTLSSQLHFPKIIAAWAARFFVGLEAAIGLLMLVLIFGKNKWVLKIYLALLVAFSIHLIILWITLGNDVDCGCMGTMMPMSPAASLLKNIGLIIGGVVLFRFYKQPEKNNLDMVAVFTILALIVAPYFIYPINTSNKLLLSELYTEAEDAPTVDLMKGKHIVSFMSLTCGHCRDAAKKIHDIHEKNATIPFYFIFPKADNDSIQNLAFADFMSDTKDFNIPYTFIDYKKFVKILNAAGETGVPSIFWISDSVLVRKVNGDQINQKEMESWLK